MASRSLFLGSFIHSKSLDELEYLHDTAICVDQNGVIVAVEPGYNLSKAEEVLFPKLGWKKEEVSVKVAKEGQFFFPGFIGLSHYCSFVDNITQISQIHTFTPPNSLTLASSVNLPFWIG